MKKTAIARVSLGFPSLVLLGFILCMNPFAQARQGWSLEEDGFTTLAADIEVLPLRKEVAESVHQIAAAAASGLEFGGRKMMASKVDEETLIGGFLDHSDPSKNVVKYDHDDQKEHKIIVEPKPPLISASSYINVQVVHSPTTQDSSAMAINDGGEEEFEEDQQAVEEPISITGTTTTGEKKKKNLLEDSLEDEIVNLMRKDYGRGPPKAKRKPPINNHEPFH